MRKRIINVSVEDNDLTIPYVHFEKTFYFNGGDGHRVIYDHHAAGGFFAIPNLNICCEACENSASIDWNRDSLINAGVRKEYAEAIAMYVKNYDIEHND